MPVSEILNKKGGPVFTIRPRASVKDAVRLFKERKIGALPVCNPSAEIIGLLTERDVLHGVAKHGAAVLDMKVEELMSRHVHTCTADDGLNHVMGLMINMRVRHVLVVVDGQLKGMISIGDIMKNRLDESQLEVDVLRDYTRTRPHPR